MKSQELSRRALNLSLAVYRVTANFPIGEVLIRQLRLLANQVAGDIAADDLIGTSKKIDRLLAYFKIASRQNWIRAINWTILNFEYSKLKQEAIILRISEKEEEAIVEEGKAAREIVLTSHNIRKREKSVGEAVLKSPGLSERQSVILAEIDKRQSIKNADLAPLFKNVSERTLRNDLKFLLEKKLIRKEGINKTAIYLSR